MKSFARVLIAFAATISWSASTSGLPTPNRGTQLFALIEERGGYSTLVAITEPSRPVIQTWHPGKGTYDFISAVVKRTGAGCRVSFIRYVMKEDYIPRVEHLDLAFLYAEQPRYPFFDYGYIIGFYRNSVDDIGPREFLPRQTPNQAMQPTRLRRAGAMTSLNL
jgi:hypothetical protein